MESGILSLLCWTAGKVAILWKGVSRAKAPRPFKSFSDPADCLHLPKSLHNCTHRNAADPAAGGAYLSGVKV